MAQGGENPLIDRIASDADFRLSKDEILERLDPVAFTGRSAEQVADFVEEEVDPLLARFEAAPIEDPRV